MLTNLANFDPIGRFMEQITGKCARSALKKISGGDKCVRGGGGLKIFSYLCIGVIGVYMYTRPAFWFTHFRKIEILPPLSFQNSKIKIGILFPSISLFSKIVKLRSRPRQPFGSLWWPLRIFEDLLFPDPISKFWGFLAVIMYFWGFHLRNCQKKKKKSL